MRNPEFAKKEIEFTILPTDGNVTNEIFNNDFDITWHHQDKKSGNPRREWTLLPGENSKDDGTVTYTYNDDYFRCDNFKKNHDGLHILFAGCSETEGMGGQIEDVWGKILLNKISSLNDVDGYFSIARAGYGWQKVITQTRVYISKYGKPDALFVLLPNIGRFVKWSDQRKDWIYKQTYPNFELSNMSNRVKDSKDEFAPESMSSAEYKAMFIDFVISWRLFEDFCEEAGIDLIWATWDAIDNSNISNLSNHNIFKNFIPLKKDELQTRLFDMDMSIKISDRDLEKRDGHHGRLFHQFWADEFIKESRTRGIIK